jgi:hypothetical protein
MYSFLKQEKNETIFDDEEPHQGRALQTHPWVVNTEYTTPPTIYNCVSGNPIITSEEVKTIFPRIHPNSHFSCKQNLRNQNKTKTQYNFGSVNSNSTTCENQNDIKHMRSLLFLHNLLFYSLISI